METKNKKSIIDDIKKKLEDLEEQLKNSGEKFKENYHQKKLKKYLKI